MKLLLVNQPLNNRGDESAHKAFVRTLLDSLPNVQITVLFVDCTYVEGIRQFKVVSPQVKYVNIHSGKGYYRFGRKPLENKQYFWWNILPTCRKIKAYYKESDYVIGMPGGICMGGFQNWTHLLFLKWAKFWGRPLVYYGRSFGPFPTDTSMNRRFKEISKEMLEYFSFLAIRDKKSEQLANEMGGVTNYYSTVDTAFLDETCVDLPYEIQSILKDRPYMVFVPNYLLWHYQYEGKATKEHVISFYSAIIKKITNKYPDYSIVMLPQTFGYDSYEMNDIFIMRDIAENVKDEHIILLPDCYSSDIQQSIIKKAKFTIGARYHSIVFSINQDVPFVALSYEHKISGLLETLNATDCSIDISKVFNSAEDLNSILSILDDKLTSVENSHSIKLLAKEKARATFNALLEFIKSSNQ